MKQRRRIYYNEEQKVLMWDRWQKGDSMHAIARLFDRRHSSVKGILSQTGGVRSARRRRSRLTLTLAEREEISRSVVTGQSFRSMATSLGRAPSTISREIRRNGGRRRYRANKADQAAWDRGKELSDHKRFSLVTDIDVYFCDPQSPWQRGSNENSNGLLRQYFPKGTDLSVHSQKHLNNVACELNNRRRKTLDFCSPAEKFNECVALTG